MRSRTTFLAMGSRRAGAPRLRRGSGSGFPHQLAIKIDPAGPGTKTVIDLASAGELARWAGSGVLRLKKC